MELSEAQLAELARIRSWACCLEPERRFLAEIEIVQLKARIAHLEFTLELEEAWEETEHTFFADFLVVKIEELQEIIRVQEGEKG